MLLPALTAAIDTSTCTGAVRRGGGGELVGARVSRAGRLYKGVYNSSKVARNKCDIGFVSLVTGVSMT